MTAALGLKTDRENRVIHFSPIEEELCVPLCLPDVLAKVTIHSGECRIHILEGTLGGWEIKMAKGYKVVIL